MSGGTRSSSAGCPGGHPARGDRQHSDNVLLYFVCGFLGGLEVGKTAKRFDTWGLGLRYVPARLVPPRPTHLSYINRETATT